MSVHHLHIELLSKTIEVNHHLLRKCYDVCMVFYKESVKEHIGVYDHCFPSTANPDSVASCFLDQVGNMYTKTRIFDHYIRCGSGKWRIDEMFEEICHAW
jgi:hypothetical protein